MKKKIFAFICVIFLSLIFCQSSSAQQQTDSLVVADTTSIDTGLVSYDSTGLQYDTLAYIARDTFTNYIDATDTTFNVLDSINSILQYLNMNKVPYGILYDKVVDLSSLGRYSDTATDSLKPVSNPLQFHQAYFEYYYSHVDTSQIIPPDSIINTLSAQYDSNIHPLVILKANFANIKQYAIDSGLLSFQNGHLYDKGDSIVSAYDTNAVTLISLGLDSIGVSTGTHKIVLDPLFILGNDSMAIDTIKLSFSNGNTDQYFYVNGINKSQYKVLPPITFNVNATDSVIVVNVTITSTNGKKLGNKFSFVNAAKLTTNSGGTLTKLEGCNGGDSYPITGYMPDVSILNDYGFVWRNHVYGLPPASPAEGTYYVFYADKNCGTHQVTNPVIFIDGFDPSNSRDAKDIYNNYINKTQIICDGIPVYLADKMRADGYDLIILDYKDGGNLIEKNGLLLAKTLEDIYSRYSSTLQDDFVVIGPSMGALVAQYGLAWMEKNGHSHHTRLYISFDGPHHGANVPLGLQKFIDYIDNAGLLNSLAQKAFQGLENTLDGYAAKQMLDLHFFSNSQSEPAPDRDRTIFLKHLNSVNTWPGALRKVAIINGNRDAINNQNVNPGDLILQFEHSTGWSWLSYKDIDWNVHASEPNETNRIMHNWSAMLGWLLLNTSFGWTNAYHVPGPNNAALDICPGSYFGGLSGMHLQDGFSSLGGIVSGYYHKANYTTFIPTVSSTASYSLTSSNYNLYQSFSNDIISSCANNTPFNWVYADHVSTDHVQVDNNIGNWFINEIEHKTQNLGTYNNNSYIHGPGNVCYNNTAIYTTAVPSTANINWSVGPGLTIFGGRNSPLCIVKSTNNSSAIASNVSCTFTPTCADPLTNSTITVNKTVYSGAPSLFLSFIPFPLLSCLYIADVTPPYYDATYEWSVNGAPWVSTGRANIYLLDVSHTGSVPINVRITHSCGVYNIYAYTPACGHKEPDISSDSNSVDGMITDDIIISPNPTRSSWLFKTTYKEAISLQLCSIQGKVLWSHPLQLVTEEGLNIPCSSLAPGVYLLKVTTRNKTWNVKLVKD